MSQKSLKIGALTLMSAALLSTGLVGCVVVPAHPHYASSAVVTVAPPAPQVEVIGVPPVTGHIWIGGYWGWSGSAHVWTPGHWEAPRPGYHWVPHAWVREGNGWRMHEGHWEQHR